MNPTSIRTRLGRVVGTAVIVGVGLAAVVSPAVAQATGPQDSSTTTVHHATGGVVLDELVVPKAPSAHQSLTGAVGAAPASVDLRTGHEIVGDQGTRSSCVGWAIGHA